MSIGNGYLRPKLAAAATAATYIAPIPKWPHEISIVPICAECRAERLETGSTVPTSPAVQFVRINLPNFTFIPLCRNHAADYSWDPARVQRFQIMSAPFNVSTQTNDAECVLQPLAQLELIDIADQSKSVPKSESSAVTDSARAHAYARAQETRTTAGQSETRTRSADGSRQRGQVQARAAQRLQQLSFI